MRTLERAADAARIETPEQYRAAVEEVHRLQQAREGSPEFARRQALRAALADYEARHQTPECYPGGPA
ncbi:MAG: hypothetical protein AB7H71_11985 [Alphaproteobacteria bacterium]